jgi:hypothetical protein
METTGGDPPKIIDLVAIINRYEMLPNLPNEIRKSVGLATVQAALHRLEDIGLIEMRRADGGRGKRSAGSLRIVESELRILISEDEARDVIANHYESNENVVRQNHLKHTEELKESK